MRQPFPYLKLLVVALPALLFFYCISQFWVNVPQQDEYRTICQFLISFVETDSWQEKLSILFTSENESKPVYYRLYFLFWYYLSGSLDFRVLMFVGNLALVGMSLILYKQFKVLKVNILYFLPVTLFLFQPQFWICSLRADTSIFYLHSVFWSIYIPYLLAQNTKSSYRWALICGFLSLATSALGLLIFVVGGLVLLYQQRQKLLISWGITFLIGYFLFLFSPHSNASAGRLITGLIHNPVQNLSLFFAYVGSFSTFSNVFSGWQVIILGIGLVFGITALIISIFLRESNKRRMPFFISLSAIFLFLVGTVLLVAFTRWVGGYENTLYELVIERNKKLFAILFPVVAYFLALLYFSERWYRLIFGVFFGISLSFFVISYLSGIPEMTFNKRALSLDSYHWRHENMLISMALKSKNPILNQVFGWFDKHYKYQFPSTFYSSFEATLRQPFDSSQTNSKIDLKLFTYAKNKTDMYQINRNYYRFVNESYENPETSWADGAYLVLKSSQNTFIVPAQSVRNAKRSFLSSGKWYRKGFAADVESVFPSGLYHIGILTVEGDKYLLDFTSKTLVIK